MDSETTLSLYSIDLKASRITIQVSAGGFLATFGHNPVIGVADFRGEAQLQPDKLQVSALHVEIAAASLKVVDGANSKDRVEIEQRMHTEVIESDAFPAITFESRGVEATALAANHYRVQITGALTLHGTTNDQAINARVLVSPDRVRASGEFTLRQSDYGIELVSAMGGALKVKDELRISFDIVAAAAAKSKDVAA
jgi:polyisoprenoid-binding protein YceI